MSQPAPPSLTVRPDGSQRAFAPGHDVVIGRDLRADVRVANPLVSRAHIVLRFDQDQGRWVAIDNGSLNGVFVDNRRVPSVDVRDGQSINLGNPDGPRLTFEVGRHEGAVGRPPQTTSVPLQARPPVLSGRVQAPQPPTSRPPAAPPPVYPSGPPTGPPGGGRAASPAIQRPAAGSPARVTAPAAGLTTAAVATQLSDADRDPAGATQRRRGAEPRDEHGEDPARGGVR